MSANNFPPRYCNGWLCWRPALPDWSNCISPYLERLNYRSTWQSSVMIYKITEKKPESMEIHQLYNYNMLYEKSNVCSVQSECSIPADIIWLNIPIYCQEQHWCIGFNLLRTDNPSSYFIYIYPRTRTEWSISSIFRHHLSFGVIRRMWGDWKSWPSTNHDGLHLWQNRSDFLVITTLWGSHARGDSQYEYFRKTKTKLRYLDLKNQMNFD